MYRVLHYDTSRLHLVKMQRDMSVRCGGRPYRRSAMSSWVIEQPERLTIDGAVTGLDVDLISGRLNVVATDGPARVEITAIGRKRVFVRHENGVLQVRHEESRKWPGFMWWLGHLTRRYRADVSIAVPRDVGGNLHMVAGSVVASGLAGGARVDVTSGRITLLGLGGRTIAKLVSGPIEALGIDGDLTMETISGEITLADTTARRVFARAISGAITCDLDNPHDSEIRLETTSGEITARVRDDSDLDVHLHAISGRVTTAFDELQTTGQRGAIHTVRGPLGAATGKLYINAVSGNISLLRRPVDYDEPVEESS
jgi:Putative adhesin